MPPNKSSSCSTSCMGHMCWSYHCEAYLITWLLLNNFLFWEGSKFFNSNLDEVLTSRIIVWANDMHFKSLIWNYHQQRHVGVKSWCETLTKYTKMSVGSIIVRLWCNVYSINSSNCIQVTLIVNSARWLEANMWRSQRKPWPWPTVVFLHATLLWEDTIGERGTAMSLECQECRCRYCEANGMSTCVWKEEVVEDVKFLL